MGNALVRASLKSVFVLFNGDIDEDIDKQRAKIRKAKKELNELEASINSTVSAQNFDNILNLIQRIQKLEESANDNVIIFKLSYPRSGTSSVETLKKVQLKSGLDRNKLPFYSKAAPSFLEDGVFKELIQGETILQVFVTDADPNNAFLQFLRRVFSTAFTAVAGGAISGLSGVLANSTATVLSKDIAGNLKGDGTNRVQTIAASDEVKISVGANGEIQVLNAGDTINFQNGILKLGLKFPHYLAVSRNPKKYVKRGAPNGAIELTLESEMA